MKVAGLSIAYNEEPLITGCIKSLEGFVEEHLIMISEKPYFGKKYPPDKTKEIAESLGAKTVTGKWKIDHDQRNDGLDMLSDYDWVIVTDADMWMLKEDMEKLLQVLERSNSYAHNIRHIPYWYDTDHVLIGDKFDPVIAVRKGTRFRHIAHTDKKADFIKGITCHHINWCAPKDVLKKIRTYSHAVENGQALNWFHNTFCKWQPGQKAVMPCGRVKFETKRQPLPDELKAYIKT